MSTIRAIYTEEPKFPATDNDPAAVRYVVGSYYVDAIGGAPTQAEVDTVLGKTLDVLRVRAAAAIDAKAEFVRLRYITGGAAQAGTYIEKAKQADDYKAAGYPATPIPGFVQAEVDANGGTITATQAANNIIAQRDQWLAKGAAIERERLKGKMNVNAALDAAAVNTARDAAITALDAL